MSEPGGSIRVRLRLSPPVRELLRGLVERVQSAAEAPGSSVDRGFAQSLPDPELLAALRASLRASGEQDAEALLAVLKAPGFGTSDLPLELDAAEAVMRESVRVRLHLHETVLRDLSVEELGGGLRFFRLPLSEQQGYACYRLLAHLEEDLLQQLDPRLAEGI
jgi:hypothetical protein